MDPPERSPEDVLIARNVHRGMFWVAKWSPGDVLPSGDVLGSEMIPQGTFPGGKRYGDTTPTLGEASIALFRPSPCLTVVSSQQWGSLFLHSYSQVRKLYNSLDGQKLTSV